MIHYRIFLDYCDWTTGLPDELENDIDIKQYASLLLKLWYITLDHESYLTNAEWGALTIPLMRKLHSKLQERIKEIEHEPYDIEDSIGKAIDELEAGGEALFWHKESTKK